MGDGGELVSDREIDLVGGAAGEALIARAGFEAVGEVKARGCHRCGEVVVVHG